MKVLYIETNLPPYCGGVERVTWNVSQYLRTIGYEVFYAYSGIDYDIVDTKHKLKYQEDNLFDLLPSFVDTNNIEIFINQGFYYRDFLRKLQSVGKNTKTKIISCCHLDPSAYFANDKSLSFKIKDLICHLLFQHGMRARILRPLYECSDALVLLSEKHKSFYIDITGFRNLEKIHVIPNPLSHSDADHKHTTARKKQLLIVARLHNQSKNIKGALRIWKEIEKRGYNDWSLIIVGSGPDEKMLCDYSKELGIKRVKWIGHVDNPTPLYKDSMILMMTSHKEAWGMTLIEAQQNGCVPIAFDSYLSLRDIITDNQDGIIVPYPYEKAYADTLEELMNNEEKWQRLSSQGIVNSQRFSIQNIGKQWDKLFKEIK